MSVRELDLPIRLLLGSGPRNPDPRVLRALGMPLIGQFDPAFTTIMDGVSEPGVRAQLLEEHGIEIMAAFGRLNGKVWRIGLMGYNARVENAIIALGALEGVLADSGLEAPPGVGVEAARAFVEGAEAPA